MSTLFASFLGHNPIRNLLRPSGVLARLPARNAADLTGKEFFPHLISGPFHHGLIIVFSAAIVMSVTGALVSLLRGRQFYYDAPDGSGPPAPRPAAAAEVTVSPNAARPAGPGRHGAAPPRRRPGVALAPGRARRSAPGRCGTVINATHPHPGN